MADARVSSRAPTSRQRESKESCAHMANSSEDLHLALQFSHISPCCRWRLYDLDGQEPSGVHVEGPVHLAELPLPELPKSFVSHLELPRCVDSSLPLRRQVCIG